MAKVMFAAVGAENISIEALSAMLKKGGHTTALAFDRALFDDKQYFPVPRLARLFDRGQEVVREIVENRPDLLAFSVFADSYRWCLWVAREVKKLIDVPVIFGGIHPTSVPERVIVEDCVDMICLGEGDYALLELVDSIEGGRIDRSIKNLWFKADGHIIKNEPRPLVVDLDELPMIDKELFEKFVPISDYYLTVTSKGCINACAYCSQNFLKKWEKGLGRFLRERSVDSVLEELSFMKKKYSFKRVDIKNNILSGSRKWTFEFLERYKKEIGVPFRIMGHPKTIRPDVAKALKEAGCWHVQIGIESINPSIRREVLLRKESNEEIYSALNAMDDAGIKYSVDYMVGLPGESEADLVEAIRLLARCKNVIRFSVFWLEYFPKVAITEMARGRGYLSDGEIDDIEEGRQENYLSTGSVRDPKRMINLKNYHLIFRILPVTHKAVIDFILKTKIYKSFQYLPQTAILMLVDVAVSFLKWDHYAIFSMKWYMVDIKNRLLRRTRYTNGKDGPFYKKGS